MRDQVAKVHSEFVRLGPEVWLKRGGPSSCPTRVAAVLAVLVCAFSSLAQTTTRTRPSDDDSWRILAAADETTLWVARTQEDTAALFARRAGTPFDRGHGANRTLSSLSVLDGDAWAAFSDGALYQFVRREPTAQPLRNLPQRVRPIDLASWRNAAYAIVPISVIEESPPGAAASSYAVMRLDGRDWTTVAAAPREARDAETARVEPRLLCSSDELMMFWAARRSQAIEYARLDTDSGTWSAVTTISLPQYDAFTPILLNGVTSIGVVRERGGGEELEVLRLVPEAGEGESWREGELRWSVLPDGISVATVGAVLAHNQQVGALVRCSDGVWRIRFAGVGEPPADETVDVATVFERPQQALRTQGLIQMITFFILLTLLGGLIIFRRNSMTNPVKFPLGCDAALAFQRLTGWLVDFLPFSFAAAVMLDMSWSDGFRALAAWALPRSDGTEALPDVNTLTWWGLSAVGHAVYCLVLELVFGRTIGKLLFQCRVVSERGTPASVGQILARNALRLIEMMPQFWIFGALVILSRNRQRIGDVFAQTVVIRPATPWPKTESDDDSKEHEGGRPPNTRDDDTQRRGLR